MSLNKKGSLHNKLHQQRDINKIEISKRVDQNIKILKKLFSENEHFVIRDLMIMGIKRKAIIVYLDILINEKFLNSEIIRRIKEDYTVEQSGESIKDSFLSLAKTMELKDIKEVSDSVMGAGCVLFVEGIASAFSLSLPDYNQRAVDEPQLEPIVRGPREGFTENLENNLALVYRRLKTPELKAARYTIGRKSQTDVRVLYLKDIVNLEVLALLKRRIELVDIDILIESAQLEEMIQDSTFSPFPQIAYTEKPDRIVAALNQGKVAIFTDGTPIALIAPSVFTDFLHPSEDYYERFYFSNLLRLLRVFTFFISLFGPSMYIALTTFHQEMIPTPLLLTFISSKAGVPFPTFIEAMIMEVAFEVLREASLRLPRTVGQAVSIVGALIIGEAAVQSGIVSRPVVIVVATTGIASFTIPAFNAGISLRMLRFPFMFIAAYSGVFGLAIALYALILHMCSLQSFGVPFMAPVAPTHWKNWLNDIFIMPYWLRKFRPVYIQSRNTERMDLPDRKSKLSALDRNDQYDDP